jgi:hypothetical protein
MTLRLQKLAVLACAALLVAGVLGSAALATPSSRTTRVSVNSNGVQGDGLSAVAAISADGRFVAFHSEAKNLVAGDTNGAIDVFVRDRKTDKTTRVSVNSHGKQGNGDSLFPSISADGRFVTFQSVATNLVGGDTNHVVDSFVRDRKTGKTERVSVDSQGKQGDANSYTGTISADGRFVAFPSHATNLVGGDTNDRDDVFVRDRETGKTTRVSVNSHGKQGNDSSSGASISADGRLLA